ncbi:9605_t:CDS:2 [Acaulospora colombiana]|uniref:9605_t:CDS:1 n=1 Tax=Acaulospora colombiana TaxID=27376 RepID=A0ACA9L6P2_9GLOM|nr:9605_t:CDS:2 [Acaulospora colombiana]
MHVVALIDQKSKQNGIDFGIGRYRCEENQFGTFRFKIFPSAKLTKYYQPFSEGDVVNLVGKFSYETVDKVEGFTVVCCVDTISFTFCDYDILTDRHINVSVATPYPKPPSGCWEAEEIPLSSPYLSFVTQPIPGSLRQVDNSQFVRTKSTIDCNFSRRSCDTRFRIGYQTDNDRFDNIATSWDAYTQFFVSGFFLHADNSELYVEATELDVDLASRRSGKNLIQASPTGYAVAGVSPLARNLSRLLEQEKGSPTISPSITPRLPTEYSFAKPNNVRNSNPTTPTAVKNSNANVQHPQYNPSIAQDDSLHQDFLRGLHAYQQILQRINIKGASATHAPPLSMFPPLANHSISTPFQEQQPSAEQIVELIGDQGMHQDHAGALNPKLQTQDFAQQQMENDRNTPVQVSSRQRVREGLPSMQAIQHLSNEQTEDHKSLTQHQRGRRKDKGKVSKPSSQNDHEQIAQPPQEVTTPQQDSESGESQDLHSNGKRTRSRKGTGEDKLKSHQSVTRATLGNRFLFYEPKLPEDSGSNANEANNAAGSSSAGPGGMSTVIATSTLKRGRKNKESTTTGQRAAKKSRSVKKSNNDGDDTASKEDGNEASDVNTPALSADVGSLEGNEGNGNAG